MTSVTAKVYVDLLQTNEWKLDSGANISNVHFKLHLEDR